MFTDCFNNPVGVASPSIIPDNQMRASSEQTSEFSAAYGRLNGTRGDGWCSKNALSDDEWLQVDIGEAIQACGLATQGDREWNPEWVTAFTLSYSLDGKNWEIYSEDSGEAMVSFS